MTQLETEHPAPMTAQERYHYEQLKPGYIRILYFEGDSAEDLIRIRMSPVRLRGPGTSFEALSYAWGNREKSRFVSINGLALAVTESLYLALLHMKRRKRELNNLYMRPALWADAICINQDDDQEKTLQVAMMAEIYHAASIVNIWLGPDDKDEAETAIKTLKDVDKLLATHIKGYRSVAASSSGLGQGDISHEASRAISDMNLQPLWPILTHKWFSRLWVVQETVCGRNPRVWFGTFSIGWELLACVAAALVPMGILHDYHDPPSFQIGYVVAIDAIRRNRALLVSTPSPAGLLEMINLTTAFEVGDPRDKIFALWSMMYQDGLEVSYEQSVRDVFITVSRWCLHYDLQLLSLAGLHLGRISIDALRLPSWCLPPNLGYFRRFESVSHFQAGICGRAVVNGAPKSKPFDASSSIYVVDALLATELDGSGCTMISWSVTTALQDRLQLLDRVIRGAEPRAENLDQADKLRLCSALLPDLNTAQPSALELIDHSSKLIFEALTCHNRGGPYPEKRTQEYTQLMSISIRISGFTDERKLCTTKNGQYAWVPGCAAEGDMIFVVRGAKVPFVLRPVHDPLVAPTNMKQYQLVGEAWVENIMEGQAVTDLEPVPWTRIDLV